MHILEDLMFIVPVAGLGALPALAHLILTATLWG